MITNFNEYKLNESVLDKELLFLEIKNAMFSNKKLMDYLLSNTDVLKEAYEKFGNKSFNQLHSEISELQNQNEGLSDIWNSLKNLFNRFVNKFNTSKKFRILVWFVIMTVGVFIRKGFTLSALGSISLNVVAGVAVIIASIVTILCILYISVKKHKKKGSTNLELWKKLNIDDYVIVNGKYTKKKQIIEFNNEQARILSKNTDQNLVIFKNNTTEYFSLSLKFLDMDSKFENFTIETYNFEGTITLMNEQFNEVYKDLELFD